MFESFASMMSYRSRRIQDNRLRGIVVDNKDPNGRGRLKVRYRDIHDNLADEDLPWSGAKNGYGAGAKNVGTVDIPPIGATVYGRHLDDSLYHPEWEVGPSSDDKKLDDAEPNYPYTRVHNDHMGNQNMHSTKDKAGNDDNTFTNTHQSGTQNVTDKDGNYSLNGANDITHSAQGNHNMMGDKGMTLSSKNGVISLNGTKVNINGGTATAATITKSRQKPQLPNTTGMTQY